MRPIYADNAATTPLDPSVREAMLPWLDCGNPSSPHSVGRAARMAIDESREILADCLNCLPGEIYFTSSATEAANLAILGFANANANAGKKEMAIAASEHHCVTEAAKKIQKLGWNVRSIPVDICGRALFEQAAPFVSVMHANNETGAINDIAKIAAQCQENGAVYFCDAVQSFGTLEFSLKQVPIGLAAISAHKIYGPKGAGLLFIRGGTKLEPQICGGGQEREMRAGTENVAAIVGFARAAQVAMENLNKVKQIESVRNAFVERSMNLIPKIKFTCDDWNSVLPGHAHFRIPGLSAEALLIKLDLLKVFAASGAACSSGSIEPSHVMLAAGYSETEASESIRFSFGRMSTLEDAVEAAERLALAASSAG